MKMLLTIAALGATIGFSVSSANAASASNPLEALKANVGKGRAILHLAQAGGGSDESKAKPRHKFRLHCRWHHHHRHCR
jgi:hypothetical protein